MLPLVIVAGLIALWLAAKKSSGNNGAANSSGPGANTQMPNPQGDPSNASLAGSAVHSLPANTAITPFAGTSKLAPNMALGRANIANRIALRDVGRPGTPVRKPMGQTVKTSNPATVPFSAIGTRSFSGTVATNTKNSRGTKL